MDELNEILESLQNQEDSREQWFEWYQSFRPKTALEPHDVTLEDINEEKIVLRMKIEDHARQPYGLLHGGISMMLAESAASIHACWGVDLNKRAPVGIEINGSHLRPATEGYVLARAQKIRKSDSLIHHHVEIVHEETGKLLSLVRVTNLYKNL